MSICPCVKLYFNICLLSRESIKTVEQNKHNSQSIKSNTNKYNILARTIITKIKSSSSVLDQRGLATHTREHKRNNYFINLNIRQLDVV